MRPELGNDGLLLHRVKHSDSNLLTQGNEIAGVTLDPAGKFQFEQQSGDGSR